MRLFAKALLKYSTTNFQIETICDQKHNENQLKDEISNSVPVSSPNINSSQKPATNQPQVYQQNKIITPAPSIQSENDLIGRRSVADSNNQRQNTIYSADNRRSVMGSHLLQRNKSGKLSSSSKQYPKAAEYEQYRRSIGTIKSADYEYIQKALKDI